MKKTFLLFFILLINISIWADFKFGLIDPLGYRVYIYSESLTTSLFTTPTRNLLDKLPDKNNFNILYTPYPKISLDIEFKEYRFSQLLEFNHNLNKNTNFKSINILSTTLPQKFVEIEETLIHHALYLKKEGIFSTGFYYINSLSKVNKRGYKWALYNNLELNKVGFISLLESRSNYITPYNKLQSNGKTILSTIELYPSKYWNIIYLNDLNYKDDIWTRENSLKLKFNLPYTVFTLNGGIKEINKREFKYGCNIINNLSFIKNEVNFYIRYINANLYYFTNTLTVTPNSDINLSAKYNFKLLEDVEQEVIGKLLYNNKNYTLRVDYTYPIGSLDKSWTLNASINHICY